MATTPRGKTSAKSTAGSFAPHNRSLPDAEPLVSDAFPLAYELGEAIASQYGGEISWSINDVYGVVLERAGARRIVFHDEADFMGSIDGYTYETQHWDADANSWVVDDQVEEPVEPHRIRELAAQLSS